MIDVDADSDNDVPDLVPFRLHLRKDTATLAAAQQKIVRPLDVGLQLAGLLNRFAACDCRNQSQNRSIAWLQHRPEQDRSIDAVTSLRKPRSAQASSALRLFLSENDRPLRRALFRKLAGSIIGGTRFEEMVDGCPQDGGISGVGI